jgi:hypothetical protein
VWIQADYSLSLFYAVLAFSFSLFCCIYKIHLWNKERASQSVFRYSCIDFYEEFDHFSFSEVNIITLSSSIFWEFSFILLMYVVFSFHVYQHWNIHPRLFSSLEWKTKIRVFLILSSTFSPLCFHRILSINKWKILLILYCILKYKWVTIYQLDIMHFFYRICK